jgi:hypothetical protein
MPEPPIACTLPTAAMPGRLALVDSLAAEALVTPIPGGIRARFAPPFEARVRELVALESRCCAFLRFDVRVGDEVVLDVTGSSDAQPVIEHLFAARARNCAG